MKFLSKLKKIASHDGAYPQLNFIKIDKNMMVASDSYVLTEITTPENITNNEAPIYLPADRILNIPDVENIAMLESNGRAQAVIKYPDYKQAMSAEAPKYKFCLNPSLLKKLMDCYAGITAINCRLYDNKILIEAEDKAKNKIKSLIMLIDNK